MLWWWFICYSCVQVAVHICLVLCIMYGCVSCVIVAVLILWVWFIDVVDVAYMLWMLFMCYVCGLCRLVVAHDLWMWRICLCVFVFLNTYDVVYILLAWFMFYSWGALFVCGVSA